MDTHHFRYFKAAVKNNPHIVNKVKVRRFAMVALLESAADITGPDSPGFDVAAGGVDARVQIQFNDVVKRMVQ